MDQNITNDRMEGSETGGRKKWKGSVTKIMKSPCDRIWKLSADFVNLNKYGKNVDKCDHVEGERNEVGCVRYCTAVLINNGADQRMTWAKEKLLTMDLLNRCYTYSIIDGNLGIEGYVATFKLCNITSPNCAVEWSFETDPSKYYEEEEFIGFISSNIEQMIQGLDETAASEESS